MLEKLKKIFQRKDRVSKQDEDFDLIVFIEDVGKQSDPYWEMQNYVEFPEHKAKIQCVGIPGDINGPYLESREFLKSKFLELSHIWETCHEELVKTIQDWFPEQIDSNPNEIFTLCAINMDNTDEWEVCFEADPPNKWLYLGLQLKGEQIVSGTLDT